MSAELFFLDAKPQVITAGQPAWHREGTTIPEGMKSLRDIRTNGVLQYDYATTKLFDENGKELEQLAISRVPCDVDGNPDREESEVVAVGISDQYKLITLEQTVETIQPLLDSGDLIISAAGSLGNGDRTFISCEVPAAADDFDGGVRSYLNSLLDYRGKGKNITNGDDFRIVCANTWRASSNDKSLRDIFPAISHKGDIEWKLQDAQRAIQAYVLAGETRAREYRSLASREMTPDELTAFFNTICPQPEPLGDGATDAQRKTHERATTRAKNRMDVLRASWTDPTSPDGKTAWRALQCVTHAVDHSGFCLTRTSKTRDAGMAELESLTFGSGATVKSEAYQLVLALIA